MRSFLLSFLLLFAAAVLFAQESKYVTHNSQMKIKARRNGNPVEWENRNISVDFNYKTGEFITYLTNTDFVNPDSDMDMVNNSDIQSRQLTLEGTLPIYEIINQQQAKQNYKVELHLKADDLNMSETILFDMLITQPESGESKSYRMFTLNGILYNDHTNFPAFKGYDNEIQLWLIFTGFMNIQ